MLFINNYQNSYISVWFFDNHLQPKYTHFLILQTAKSRSGEEKNNIYTMIGKIFAHFLGSTEVDFPAEDNETYKELIEVEKGGWVIINIQENNLLIEDPFENRLIENPSMSVYQVRCLASGEEDQSSDEEESPPGFLPVKHYMSRRLAAWGSSLPSNAHLLAVQRARTHRERKTRSALHKQSLAKMRFPPSDRRYGHFKQPCQRVYNY
ncbi:uncharacterized protein si:ch211-260e23.9 [Esox lucius]|uniref:Uncharacterized protein n=2 Tax=Esox lucius TaxID=8010 RepID=A0AAY5KNH5_ESOLU|nr:uncharacterized protein si:ch211-260e23.9 [Esox lucius]